MLLNKPIQEYKERKTISDVMSSENKHEPAVLRKAEKTIGLELFAMLRT